MADTDSVASVATVVAEAIPHDLAEENDGVERWGHLESADDVEEEIPFRHPRVRSCQLGFRSLMSCSCVMHLTKRLSDAECPRQQPQSPPETH